jgi:hypothetical protein
MPSKSDNFFTRIKENVMGTKEENAQAEKDIAKYKESKAKEKAAEEAKKTKMAKGGAVKKSSAKKTASKKPTLAVMIAVGKPKMNKGGLSSGKQSPAGMSKKKC